MILAVLSISFEVDVPTGKVGSSLLFQRLRCKLAGGGVWGHAPPLLPRKIWNSDAWKCYFQCFPDSIWALRTIKLKTVLTIFYVYYNWLFFSSKTQSMALRKERNDKSSNADSKKYSHCFKFMLFLKKRDQQWLSASVSLTPMPFWHMQKRGI